jgi:hypothetical protein
MLGYHGEKKLYIKQLLEDFDHLHVNNFIKHIRTLESSGYDACNSSEFSYGLKSVLVYFSSFCQVNRDDLFKLFCSQLNYIGPF